LKFSSKKARITNEESEALYSKNHQAGMPGLIMANKCKETIGQHLPKRKRRDEM